MIDWEFQWHSTPPERFQAVPIALLAIASFIIHYLVWQVGNKRVNCSSEYPFTGLLPEMFSVAFLDPSAFHRTNVRCQLKFLLD